MLWVLNRTFSMRQFFCAPKTNEQMQMYIYKAHGKCSRRALIRVYPVIPRKTVSGL